MDFINKYNQRNLEVLTNKNYYQWDYNKNTIKKYNPKIKKLNLFFKGKINKNLSYKEELKNFFKQNNQIEILKNLNMAISTQILIDGAKKSKINNMKKTFLNFKNV